MISWAIAGTSLHDIAEQLEHIRDYDLPDRLEKFLGFPEITRTGNPIPKSNGNLPVKPVKTPFRNGSGQ